MAIDFEFSKFDREWQSRRLDPFKQAAMLKRVVPLLGPLIPLMVSAQKENMTQEDALKALEEYAPGLALGIQSLKDEDLNWLLETCLGTLKVLQDGNWMQFWNKSAHRCQYDDLNDLAYWLPLTIQVIKDNLSPFFLTTATGLPASTTTTPP